MERWNLRHKRAAREGECQAWRRRGTKPEQPELVSDVQQVVGTVQTPVKKHGCPWQRAGPYQLFLL